MRAQFLKYWERVRSSSWFLPSLMAAVAVGLSFYTVSVDQAVTQKWLHKVDWVCGGGAEGASAVLQTIAGSMITIAGVMFSLMLVALSLASSQFGSRILRNFLRDTANQLVLGTFIATFPYRLLVLRTIRREDGRAFVPLPKLCPRKRAARQSIDVIKPLNRRLLTCVVSGIACLDSEIRLNLHAKQ